MRQLNFTCAVVSLMMSSKAFALEIEDPKNTRMVAAKSVKSKTSKNIERENKKSGEINDNNNENTQDIFSRARESINKPRTSRDHRKDSFLSVNWSPLVLLSFPLPKSGFQIGWIANEAITFDPEYLSGGFSFSISELDLGKISDSLITLPVRYFPGNSFNYRIGLTYRKLDVELGDAILSNIVDLPAYLELLEYSFYALNAGIGNRWQLDNGITLGADWFDLNIPLSTKRNEKITTYITNEADKERVKKGIDILTAVQLSALKFQVGYTF